MESIVGKILCDRYRILQELDRQQFSTVYMAEDLEQLDRPSCDIEQLQSQYDREVLGAKSWQQIRQNFMERGNRLKKVAQHPQIPQLLDFFECDREFYVVREHLEGETLARKLAKSPIAEAEAISWLHEILEILQVVHQANIVHSNIQPSSLLQHRNGTKFLIDFAFLRNAVLPQDTVIVSNFTAPEAQSADDYSSDIYALGKTIIYALSGKVAQFIQAQSMASTDSKIPSADIKPELADVLNKMVAERSVRYQSAAEVLVELDSNRNVVTFPPPFFDNDSAFNPALPRGKAKLTSRGLARSGRKSIWLLLALPFIIALGIVFIGVNKNSNRDFANYVNYDYQFDIKHPQSWSQQEINDPITGEIVVFTSPTETDSDRFRERVYLATEYLSSPTTLEEYTQTVLERIEQAANSEIYEEFATEINRLPSRAVVYSRQEEGLELKQMEVFTIKDDRVYIAIYTAQKDKFSKFIDTVDRIIDSWQIK